MGVIFHEAIYQPLYNILIFLYNTIPGQDFGIAIVVATLLIKAALMPISKKQIESQKRMQDIQPQIKEIQNKHKNDKEKQTKEIMKFYKENKVNPFSGCLPLIVQLVFLIAIYRVLINISASGLVISGDDLYSFIHNPGGLRHMFLGIVDLTKPSILFAILAAGAQFWQTKMLLKKQADKSDKKEEKDTKNPDFAQMMSKQMLILGPAMTLFIGITFAAGLSLYWLVSTLFAVFQQLYIFKKESQKGQISRKI